MDEIQETAVLAGNADDDWGDIDLSDLAEGEENGGAEPETEADQPEAEAGEQEPETETQGQEPETGADQLFELKHLDETRTVDREEVIVLAQKGMDYDRIREKWEAGKDGAAWYEANGDSVRWLEEMAKEQGMTFAEMVDSARAQIMASRTNQSLEVCRGIVANERKAAELERKQKALDAGIGKTDAETAARERMQADIQAFTAAYPEQARDPNGIPKEVWDAVHKGETLVNAYRAYENRQLKEQLEKEKAEAAKREQETKNKARSTGSQRSSGRRSDMDAFDAAWYDGN